MAKTLHGTSNSAWVGEVRGIVKRYCQRTQSLLWHTLSFWVPAGALDLGLTTLGIVYGACFGDAAVLVGSILTTPDFRELFFGACIYEPPARLPRKMYAGQVRQHSAFRYWRGVTHLAAAAGGGGSLAGF